MPDKRETATKQGAPVAPTAGDLDREMDPTKRQRKESPDGGVPDMGGDMPDRGTDKDVPHTPPTR